MDWGLGTGDWDFGRVRQSFSISPAHFIASHRSPIPNPQSLMTRI
jgi:hypothetical protein